MTARVAMTGKTAFPAQTVVAKVALAGTRARIDSTLGGSRSVVLFSPPYVYRLLPDAKAGVRWKTAKTQSGANFGGFNPEQLLREPAKIRAELLQSGAKRTGIATLDGTPVEIYESARPGDRFSRVKAWIRRSDALPARLEASGSGVKVTASWKNYARPKLAGSFFAPPKGYSIRESKNPPALALL